MSLFSFDSVTASSSGFGIPRDFSRNIGRTTRHYAPALSAIMSFCKVRNLISATDLRNIVENVRYVDMKHKHSGKRLGRPPNRQRKDLPPEPQTTPRLTEAATYCTRRVRDACRRPRRIKPKKRLCRPPGRPRKQGICRRRRMPKRCNQTVKKASYSAPPSPMRPVVKRSSLVVRKNTAQTRSCRSTKKPYRLGMFSRFLYSLLPRKRCQPKCPPKCQ